MSSVLPAKCRVEIFCGPPTLFDDHFCKGWTPSQGSITLDGDNVKLTIGTGYVDAGMERSHEFDSSVFKYFVVRCRALGTTSFTLQVRRKDTGAWLTVDTYTSTGLKEADISTVYSGVCDKIEIAVHGSEGQYGEFDYVALCKTGVLTPISPGEVVEDLTVTRPLLAQGVSGAKVTITNFNGEYTGKIKSHDVIMIWLARDSANLGDYAYKVFGGRIVNPTNRGVGSTEFYMDLDCHGHAYELINPPALLQKLYSTTNGRTIIEDALALCNYVTRHPTDSKWFDAGGASGSTDDRINSNHSCEYDEVKPKTVIDEITEKASNPAGVQGFDIVEMPSGVLMGHLRNSLDFVSPIASITPENYEMSSDVHRIRNKQKVYGKAGKIGVPGDEGRCEPFDKDLWTVDDIDNWVAEIGTCEIDTGSPKVGSNFLWGRQEHDGPLYETRVRRSVSLVLFGHGKYQTLNFFAAYGILSLPQTTKVMLYAPDYSNRFEANIDSPAVSWKFYQYQLGQNQEYDVDKNPTGPWTKVGSPNWGNVTAIAFYASRNVDDFRGQYIDGLYFGHGRWRGSAEDATSQASYGVREAEPLVDEALGSDVECLFKALALVAFYKDPVTSLENVLVDGDHYTPGDRQRIIVSNDNLDAYFRILEVKHVVRGVNWDTILKMNNEPVYIKCLFEDFSIALSRLRRG